MKNNITSNRDYVTENINLRQQIINLKVANKDKAETIKSMKQELIEYSELRDRFKVLYEENQKYKQLQEQLGCPLDVVFKAIEQDEIYVKFFDEIQHWSPIKIDLRNKKIWYSKQTGGHYALQQSLNRYGVCWFLKEDWSENNES